MKKIVAFNGSARKTGNTSILLESFINGAQKNTNAIKQYYAHEINLQYCTGCLRCNILKKCSLRDDDWEKISREILEADVLVFASPIYFHHVSAQLKKIIDRFRSFVHVQITETGLIHTPHLKWEKDFVLLLSMGSSDDIDAKPVIELFEYMTNILGAKNKLHVISGTRLAVVKQIAKTENELDTLYKKINLPQHLVSKDTERNKQLLKQSFKLGEAV